MTVPTETARSGPYLGNGVTDTFAYEFRILAETHLRATIVDGGGIESVLTLGADYSVTDVGNTSGGSVILTGPLASGLQLVITRSVPATQETDLENQGAFLAEVIETALDKATMLIQQEGERSDRTVTLPVTSLGVSAELPGAVANALLGWNADGSALENKTPNDGTVLPTLLGNLTTAEITQLLNINATTISATQWGYLGGLGAAPLEPNAPAAVTSLSANTVSASNVFATNIGFSGLLSSAANINGLLQVAQLRNQNQGSAASTQFSLGNFADANDFTITLNGTGNNTGPGLRGTTIRANGGAMHVQAAGGLTLPDLVTSNSNQNSAVPHLLLRNLNGGASAATQFAIGNDAASSDFTITLNGSGNIGGVGSRGVLVNANVGSLLLSGGGTQLRLDSDGVVRSTTVYNATTATAANMAVDAGGGIRRSSSARKYKREIADYTRGLADLQTLRPVIFKSIDPENNSTYAGFIAEEVHEAGLAEFVFYVDGQPDALHYPHMIALAVAAVKELAGQVAALQGEVASLESRVTSLETP